MELIRTQAIVLKKVDYGEKDRIITLYSADYGKITVSCKGCNSAKSKLFPCTQPRVFAEYELGVSREGKYVLRGYHSIDLFFELNSDLHKYYVAECMLELFDRTVPEATLDNQFFALTLRSLTALKTAASPAFILAKYYMYLMRNNGVELNLDYVCVECGEPLTHFEYGFSLQGFVCKRCATITRIGRNSVIFSGEEAELLRLIDAQNMDDGAGQDYDLSIRLLCGKLNDIAYGAIGLSSTVLAQYLKL